MPIDVGESQLRSGVRSFLAGDHAHPGGPVVKVEQGRDFCDPSPVAQVASGFDGRDPRVFLEGVDRCFQVREESGESHRVRQFLVGEVVGEGLGPPGGVGADKDPALLPGVQLLQGC
jgi:hypothetical protein